jgi:hypothetical protein
LFVISWFQISVRENREWIIQRHSQHWARLNNYFLCKQNKTQGTQTDDLSHVNILVYKTLSRNQILKSKHVGKYPK